jgi:tRNA threonylcarbamoyladenosine biosynthesis protein TsaB
MPVMILGIDTATPQVGCAVAGPDGLLASFHSARGRRHAETLAPALAFVCEQAGVALDQIGTVAVDIGPGLFTGLRVGLATATAIAGALGVPMVGLSSLDLLAVAARPAARLIASVVDARRGEVFWALYRPTPTGMQRLSDYAVDEPGRLVAVLAERAEDCLAVGDGARRYASRLDGIGTVEVAGAGYAYPSAERLVEEAGLLAMTGRAVPPEALTPLYLRTADVRINWEQRQVDDDRRRGAVPSAGQAR